MKRKGIKFSKVKHLGWRDPQHGDTYMDGSQIRNNYVVIVRLKDCEIKEQNGRKVYDASEAPAIDMEAHGRTNMAYGKRRTYKGKNYDTQSVYWVEDGFVYRGSIHLEKEPHRQPYDGWYDGEGRYYIAQAKGMDWDSASEAITEINETYNGRRVALMRESREAEGWDVFIHHSYVDNPEKQQVEAV